MDNLINLQELFNRKIFRIPDYQRGYSWRTKQLGEFWDDLLSLLPDQDHYTGMLSLKEVTLEEINRNPDKWVNEQWLLKSGYRVNEIVDGQQRLTTLIILINEIINYCKARGIEVLNGADRIEDIQSQFIFKQKPGGIIRTYIFGYDTNNNQSNSYFKIAVLDDPDKASVEETFYTLNLSNAKNFFAERLKKLSLAEVEDIYSRITVNLKFNVYNIKNNFNVFVAFETMNNRGKRLSSLELLKNRLIYLSTLFNCDEDEKETVRKEINETWKDIYEYLGKNKNRALNDDEFLQHHWMIYFGYSTRKTQGNNTIPFNEYLLTKRFIQQNIDRRNFQNVDIIEEEEELVDDAAKELSDEEDIAVNSTETTAEQTSNLLTLTDIKKYIGSLRELIPFWYQTYEPSMASSEKIAKYLSRLNILGYINARPLATVILSKDNIDDETKAECLRLIERFNFLHYRLNNYASTFSSTIFYNLARDLYNGTNNIEDVLKTIRTIDAYYMSPNNVIISDGPIDKFNKLAKYDGFYSWNTLRYLLYIYDLKISGGMSAKEKIDPDRYFKQDARDKCSIEHIYPQTPTNDYWTSRFGGYPEADRKKLVCSLGNMLPLSLEVNKSLQNNSFDDKKYGTADRKRRGYINGSSSELEVAAYDEWTPQCILERGMKILNFMEEEFDFKFPDDLYRKKILGLDFMAKENDENEHKTEPISELEVSQDI